MTNERETPRAGSAIRPRLGSRAVLAAIAAVAGLAAVYVTLGRPDNGPDGKAAGQSAAARVGHAGNQLAVGEMAAFVAKKSAEPLADIRFKDAGGADRTLADWRGKVVLLNLWATWCVPCRKEMPSLDALQAKLGNDGFEVVAINIDTRDPDKPKTWLKDAGIARLAYYSDNKAKSFQDLKAAGRALGDTEPVDDAAQVRAARESLNTLLHVGKAQLGDKTMVDAFVPFVETLETELAAGTPIGETWQKAAAAAAAAAQATAPMRPRIGRARPLADRSVGHADAGAVSFAYIVQMVAERMNA